MTELSNTNSESPTQTVSVDRLETLTEMAGKFDPDKARSLVGQDTPFPEDIGGGDMPDTVLNIYGNPISTDSKYGKMVWEMRTKTPDLPSSEYLRDVIFGELKREQDNGFYLYVHKTKRSNLNGIFSTGLKIHEESGGLESTMARAFDSKSENLEEDFNYLLNSIVNESQYGSCTVVAIFPHNHKEIAQIIKDKKVPISQLLFGFDSNKMVFDYSGKNL